MHPLEKKIVVVLVFLSFFFLIAVPQWALALKPVPGMTKEELKTRLGTPDIVILDVRIGGEWAGSKEKIQGAVRQDPEQVQNWADKLPKDRTLILYCS